MAGVCPNNQCPHATWKSLLAFMMDNVHRRTVTTRLGVDYEKVPYFWLHLGSASSNYANLPTIRLCEAFLQAGYEHPEEFCTKTEKGAVFVKEIERITEKMYGILMVQEPKEPDNIKEPFPWMEHNGIVLCETMDWAVRGEEDSSAWISATSGAKTDYLATLGSFSCI